MCCGRSAFTHSACNVIDSRVCEHLSDEQIQTASLLQECIMVRDGLAHLPDVLRLVICLISFVTCACADCSACLSVCLFIFSLFLFFIFLCVLCVRLI